MSNSSGVSRPNPDTPLAFLPPALADQLEASRYVYVASLAAFMWDWVMSMPDEYQIFRNRKVRLPFAIYLLSRVGTLAFIVTNAVFQIAPVGSCPTLQFAIGWCFVVAVSGTASLFFFRVRAVFDDSRLVVTLFAVTWLSILGSSILVPFGISGAHIGPTNRCINTLVKEYSSAPVVINTVNDTLVFVAITWRLAHGSFTGTTWRDRANYFFKGDGLPRISKALLQGGQLYYLATVGLNLVTTVLLVTPGVPPVLHAMFTIPNIALENSMACRVYRYIIFSAGPTSSKTSYPSRSNRGNVRGYEGDNAYPLEQSVFHESRAGPVNIEITKSVETDALSYQKSGGLMEYAGEPV